MRVLTLALFAAACTPDDAAMDGFLTGIELPADQQAPPGRSATGCGDTQLYITNTDDSMLFLVTAPGIIEHAYADMVSDRVYSFDLPSEHAAASIQLGSHMGLRYCTDEAMELPPLEGVWNVVGGQLSIEVIDPTQMLMYGLYADVRVTLVDGVAEDVETGRQRALPDLQLVADHVGSIL